MNIVDGISPRLPISLGARSKSRCRNVFDFILAGSIDDERLFVSPPRFRRTVHVGVIERNDRRICAEVGGFEILGLFGHGRKDEGGVAGLLLDTRKTAPT